MTLEMQVLTSEKYLAEWGESLKESFFAMLDTLGMKTAEAGFQRIVMKKIDELNSYHLEGLLQIEEVTKVMDFFNKVLTQHKMLVRGLEKSDVNKKSFALESTESEEEVEEPSPSERAVMHSIGDLLVPKDIDSLPLLSPRLTFIAPKTIDLRDYCTRTVDQSDTPCCAACAACGFAGDIYWRKTDMPSMYDWPKVYKYAKSIDGMANAKGTTLNAALQYFLDNGDFDKGLCSIKVLRNVAQVKYAIHKFGCCLLGLLVTDEWYKCGKHKSTISGGGSSLGGHAVLCCGYNRDGVIIQNSWGEDWGSYGFALITWEEFEKEFQYGAVIDNCLYDMKMN